MFDTRAFLIGFLKVILIIILIVGIIGTPVILIMYASEMLTVSPLHVVFPLMAALSYGLMEGFDLFDD